MKALFNRLTSGGTESGWRMSQREEEEYGMTTEVKNAVGEEEVKEEAEGRNGRKRRMYTYRTRSIKG